MKSKQHKNKHEKLLNSRIAILAMGRSLSDYLVESVAGESFDEVWGINSIGGIIKVDRTFMLDPASRYLDTENAGTQTILARKFLLDKEQKNPIYSCELDSRVPSIQEYPIEEVLSEFKISYLNNTVPYAIAYAIYKKVSSQKHKDDKINVEEHYFLCEHLDGKIILLEHEDIKWVTKKAKASQEELGQNVRSRSAILRVVEKL